MPTARQPAVGGAAAAGTTGDTGAGRPGLGRPKRGKDETRARILAAAHELFATRGFDATTVKDIGAKAGITDAALYYHFRSKREILDAAWEIPESRAMRAGFPGKELGARGLEYLIDVMLDGAIAQDGFLRLMARQVLAHDRTALALRNQTMAAWRQYMRKHFETAFSLEEAEEMADSLAMLILGVYTNTQIDHGAATARVLRDRAFRDYVKAMARTMFPLEDPAAPERPCAQ